MCSTRVVGWSVVSMKRAEMEADELDLGGNVDGGDEHEIVGILRTDEGGIKSMYPGILVAGRTPTGGRSGGAPRLRVDWVKGVSLFIEFMFYFRRRGCSYNLSKGAVFWGRGADF